MTRFKLIFNSFNHYLKANLLVAAGVAISTAVLTGALMIGDSVTFSLQQSTFYRLGNTTHIVSGVDRFFRKALAKDIAEKSGLAVAPALILEGIATTEGGGERVNKVQISGIDSRFEIIAGTPIFNKLTDNEVIIGINLAERLHLKKGDSFMVRIKRASLIPLNAPFVSNAETSVSFRAVVKEIADQQNMGFFNLKNAQTAPYNLFLSLAKLNDLMKLKEKVNRLLISAPNATDTQITDLLQSCFTTEDTGLKVKRISLTNETEITSDRVFIEDQIVNAFKPFSDSHLIMTYFANSMEFKKKSTPYSFISTIDDKSLSNNDIIINDWVASDLNAKQGDSLKIKYFEIGPLRQLTEKGAWFVIKRIVPIEGKYADKDLMPFLPGMSDAGHCRDWEAGVPVNLGAIRAKDEAYWNKYKGTPKAFISLNRARQIWSNRFGKFTAIRISDKDFSDKAYKALFAASIKPANLGIVVTPVRENGLKAASNGIDFSQLFFGLSFFLLLAAIILTALIFLLNLEDRQSELGTLTMLGFSRNQIRRFFLYEGVAISVTGGLFGLVIAVVYTKLIFISLNTLWWAVVRTSVLILKINTLTLFIGLIISIVIAIFTILMAMHRNFKRQAIELQRIQDQILSPIVAMVKKGLMTISILLASGLIIFQLVTPGILSSSLFFLSGGLMLSGLLLFADFILRRDRLKIVADVSFITLNKRNRSQNLGRSLTVIILFALGTFLVVSTGANRQDSLTNGKDKKSGTGGYHFFSETSVPVLFSLNDKDRRLKEGIATNFNSAQFSRLDGDDASCLNLNRVTNPAVLGAEPAIFKDRFSFETKCPEIHDKEVWEAFNESGLGKVVPGLADQTVIEWGLGLKIGDTITYRNEFGEPLRVKLIAGLSPSVFQGYVLISNANFLKNFPTNSGSHLFLIDTPEENAKVVGEELSGIFRDYGWEMTTTVERLMEFNSVTNTYLSIFLALGALGLILGTVGLAVVLARSILERKKEIVLLQSLGFRKRQVISLLVQEYAVLLLWGVLIGCISAVIAVLPTLLSTGGKVSLWTVILIAALIIVNGVVWIFGLSLYGLRQKKLIINLTT